MKSTFKAIFLITLFTLVHQNLAYSAEPLAIAHKQFERKDLGKHVKIVAEYKIGEDWLVELIRVSDTDDGVISQLANAARLAGQDKEFRAFYFVRLRSVVPRPGDSELRYDLRFKLSTTENREEVSLVLKDINLSAFVYFQINYPQFLSFPRVALRDIQIFDPIEEINAPDDRYTSHPTSNSNLLTNK